MWSWFWCDSDLILIWSEHKTSHNFKVIFRLKLLSFSEYWCPIFSSFSQTLTTVSLPPSRPVSYQKPLTRNNKNSGGAIGGSLSVHQLLQSLVISDFGQLRMSKGPVWDGRHRLLTPLHFRNKLTSDGTETQPNLEGRNVGCKPKGDSSRRLFIF